MDAHTLYVARSLSQPPSAKEASGRASRDSVPTGSSWEPSAESAAQRTTFHGRSSGASFVVSVFRTNAPCTAKYSEPGLGFQPSIFCPLRRKRGTDVAHSPSSLFTARVMHRRWPQHVRGATSISCRNTAPLIALGPPLSSRSLSICALVATTRAPFTDRANALLFL